MRGKTSEYRVREMGFVPCLATGILQYHRLAHATNTFLGAEKMVPEACYHSESSLAPICSGIIPSFDRSLVPSSLASASASYMAYYHRSSAGPC